MRMARSCGHLLPSPLPDVHLALNQIGSIQQTQPAWSTTEASTVRVLGLVLGILHLSLGAQVIDVRYNGGKVHLHLLHVLSQDRVAGRAIIMVRLDVVLVVGGKM